METQVAADPWKLVGPNQKQFIYLPAAAHVTVKNDRGSDFTIDFWKNGKQVGSLGDGSSHELRYCRAGDRIEVRSPRSAGPEESATGVFNVNEL